MLTAQNVEDGEALKIETTGESFEEPLSQGLPCNRRGSNRDPGNEIWTRNIPNIFKIFTHIAFSGKIHLILFMAYKKCRCF